MKEITADERFLVVEEAIFGAFLKLTKEKELEKITVSDVIKTAGIARSTFYNHYSDIPELIEDIKDRTIRDIFTMMKAVKPKSGREMIRAFYLSVLTYTMDNPFLAELLGTPHADDFFDKAMGALHHYVADAASQTEAQNHSHEEVSYAIACVIGSTVGVLHKWTRDRFDVPKEKIADLMTNMFMSLMPMMS